jgi:hypothetical protein
MNLANILILTAWVAAVAFPVLYFFTASWSKSLLGKSLMFTGTTIALLLSLGVMNIIFGEEYPGKSILRPIIIGAVFIMVWFTLISYYKAWRAKRKESDPNRKVKLCLPTYASTSIRF